MSELDKDYGALVLKEDILHFTYKKSAHINLELAKKIVQDRLSLVNNKIYPVIIKDAGMKGVEKDARDYLSSDEGVQGLSASAIVANSEFFRFLVNFFIKVNVISPKIPVKVFTDEKKALEWLVQFRK